MSENKDVKTAGEETPASAPPSADEQAGKKPGLPEGWREMKAGELAQLCKAAGLPAGGGRAELVKRLETHYYGSDRQHANGRVVCPYCKDPARCNGTRRMSDTLLRRTYRCSGRRRHSFTLDEQIKPSVSANVTAGKDADDET